MENQKLAMSTGESFNQMQQDIQRLQDKIKGLESRINPPQSTFSI